MKVRYTGKNANNNPQRKLSLYTGDLEKNKIYEVLSIERGWYRIIDNSHEDYLYPKSEFEIIDQSGVEMLKNGEWELIICNDPYNDYELIAEVNKDDNCIAFINTRSGKRTITWFNSSIDIDIPFDWFLEAMRIADSRVKR